MLSTCLNYIKRHPHETIGYIAVVCFILLSVIFDIKFLLFIPLLYILLWLCEVSLYFLFRKKPLDIHTPDGSDEPFHPSVLYFKDGWNGYKYWMAFTPMPNGTKPQPYIERWECPCVYVSNDGKNFTDAHGYGYLDDLTESIIKNEGYFSDCQLVYDKENDRIRLIYRLTDYTYDDGYPREHVLILTKHTYDGKKWSDREILLNLDNEEKCGQVVVSPSVVHENSVYKMWYISSYGKNHKVSVSASSDLKNWDDKHECVFHGKKVDPWHLDCMKDSGKYFMTVYELANKLTLWESDDGINFYYRKTLLTRSHICGQFYSYGLYRACLIKADNYQLYFSATYSGYCCIGLAEGDTIDGVKLVSAEKNISFRFYANDFATKYFYLFTKLVKQFLERLNA